MPEYATLHVINAEQQMACVERSVYKQCFQTTIENRHNYLYFPFQRSALIKKKTNQIDFLNLLWGIQIKSKRGQIAAK